MWLGTEPSRLRPFVEERITKNEGFKDDVLIDMVMRRMEDAPDAATFEASISVLMGDSAAGFTKALAELGSSFSGGTAQCDHVASAVANGSSSGAGPAGGCRIPELGRSGSDEVVAAAWKTAAGEYDEGEEEGEEEYDDEGEEDGAEYYDDGEESYDDEEGEEEYDDEEEELDADGGGYSEYEQQRRKLEQEERRREYEARVRQEALSRAPVPPPQLESDDKEMLKWAETAADIQQPPAAAACDRPDGPVAPADAPVGERAFPPAAPAQPIGPSQPLGVPAPIGGGHTARAVRLAYRSGPPHRRHCMRLTRWPLLRFSVPRLKVCCRLSTFFPRIWPFKRCRATQRPQAARPASLCPPTPRRRSPTLLRACSRLRMRSPSASSRCVCRQTRSVI